MNNILTKLGGLLLLIQPWLVFLVVVYLLVIGVACMISEKFRAEAKNYFIGGIIGLGIAFGAGPLGQNLAGVFQLGAVLTMFI